ncbi:MAG: TlpA family protein disulfide reductase [Flavobacteriales bacterium]|nr:TlpA family protein disulfide reductase [Flavobacteriales bacterium]
MPRALFPAFILLLLTGACQQPATKVPEEKLFTGAWHMALDLDTTSAYKELPFQFELARKGSGWQMTIHNQDEAIVVDSIVLNGDSIRIRMPFFGSEFRGMVKGQKLFQGLWYNHYKGPDYTIPFTATAGEQPRFAKAVVTASTDVSGDWEVHFTDDGDDEPAIGIFSVDHGHVKGSFATETGDLRFLEGVTTKDSLFLSSFNGSQAFLFSAAIRPDSLLGEFRSGHHWKQPWYAVRNPHFALADDETMTQLDMKYPVAFSFPDTEGTMHSLSDEKYRDHAVVVEIMGTWCPNCMDESRMLHEFYAKYHKDGLEAVAICFERYPDSAASVAAIRHFKEKLGVDYDMLYAGFANTDSVRKKLPFISQLKSYPTTLLIGRDGTVRRIFTGIYGPGTGARYTRFKDRMENTIVELLREPVKG